MLVQMLFDDFSDLAYVALGRGNDDHCVRNVVGVDNVAARWCPEGSVNPFREASESMDQLALGA
jgi:hypothetical protein